MTRRNERLCGSGTVRIADEMDIRWLETEAVRRDSVKTGKYIGRGVKMERDPGRKIESAGRASITIDTIRPLDRRRRQHGTR